MDLTEYLQMLARYNRIANERLFETCSLLDDAGYRRPRPGSFGSIHALLNHILLGDRIWMSRFEGAGHDTPPLNTVLFHDFNGLRHARTAEDTRIERFFESAGANVFTRSLNYRNSKGRECADPFPMAIAHFFNHQTHHRGQVHVMLSQTAVPPPSLDLHRIIDA